MWYFQEQQDREDPEQDKLWDFGLIKGSVWRDISEAPWGEGVSLFQPFWIAIKSRKGNMS